MNSIKMLKLMNWLATEADAEELTMLLAAYNAGVARVNQAAANGPELKQEYKPELWQQESDQAWLKETEL